MKLYAEKCTRSSFILHTEDGAQAVYHKKDYTGKKWSTFDKEPACFFHMELKEKQRILTFLSAGQKNITIIID